MKRLLLPLLGAPLLCSCRIKSPVENHWLRIPADAAGDLSTIQRAQWLSEAKPSLPKRRALTATGHLVLPGTATLRGSQFAGAEVLLYSGGSREALAVIVQHADSPTARLHLLTRKGALYTDHTSVIPGGPVAAGWKANGALITGLRAGGPVTVMWDGSRWRLQ